MNDRLYPCALLLLSAALPLAGCHMSDPGDDIKQAQTAILRMEIEPSPVSQGETAIFTAVIEDSTDQSFEFSWYLDAPTRVTQDNSIQWSADFEGVLSGYVYFVNTGPLSRKGVRE